MERLLKDKLVGKTDDELGEMITTEFQIERSELDKIEILIGSIDWYDYEGDAYFLIRDRATGNLYEVTGSHCSCMGFEDQWKPQITSKEYLLSQNYRWRDDEMITQFLTRMFGQ